MSTTSTDALIQQLCKDCESTKRLSCPMRRTATWFALAVPFVALVALLVPLPGDEHAGSRYHWLFLVEQVAMLATAVTAAIAAFAATIPGYRKLALLPLAALALWIGAVAYGAHEEGLSYGLAELARRPDWWCVRSIMALGAVPAFLMAFMLRQGARVVRDSRRPRAVK